MGVALLRTQRAHGARELIERDARVVGNSLNDGVQARSQIVGSGRERLLLPGVWIRRADDRHGLAIDVEPLQRLGHRVARVPRTSGDADESSTNATVRAMLEAGWSE